MTAKTAKIMNGDITSAALRQCQRAVISCRYSFFTFLTVLRTVSRQSFCVRNFWSTVQAAPPIRLPIPIPNPNPIFNPNPNLKNKRK